MPSEGESTLSNGAFNLDRAIHWRKITNDEERKRQEAILELIVTEVNYYQRLTVIHEIFYCQSEKFLSEREREKIFQNLNELLLRSGLLVSDLRSLQSKHKGVIPSITELFFEHMKHFSCFRTYCIGHEEGSRVLHRKLEENSRFAKFVKEAVNDPRCCNLDLGSFLLEPVQRLARYPLLFKQILHYTAKGHDDHYDVLQIVMDSEAYLAAVNEAVREHESQLRLAHFQNNLLVLLDGEDADVEFELIGATRKNVPRSILMETSLWKCKSKRKLIGLLLTDMLVLLEPNGSKYSLYRQPFGSDEIILKEIDYDITNVVEECTFEIKKGSDSVLVACETMADRQKWFKQFQVARQALARPMNQLPVLNLPCMGTVLINLMDGVNLAGVHESYCVLELNNQRVEMRPALGHSPTWNQSVVLSMASFDDHLYISVFDYQKYAPNRMIGSVDLSLDFLEYYDHRSTDRMALCVGKGRIFLTLQFHSL